MLQRINQVKISIQLWFNVYQGAVFLNPVIDISLVIFSAKLNRSV